MAAGKGGAHPGGGSLMRRLGFVLAILAGGAVAVWLVSREPEIPPYAVVRLAPNEKAHEAPPPPFAQQTPATSGKDAGAAGSPSGEAEKNGLASKGALSPVPDPDLVKMGRNGPLPVVGPDDRKVRDVYARPFDKGDPRPRIALVVGGLGLSRSMTESAIRTLPPAVTLSFTPYAKDLQLMVNAAREAGHEVLLELPMEPFDYPHNDPGQYTLLTQSDVEENMDKLDWLLSRFSGYAGVVSDQGDRLLSSIEDLKPIIVALSKRGLYFLDHGNTKHSMVGQVARAANMPWGESISTIDQGASRAGIDWRLLQLEEAARERGVAIGTGYAFPVTIERIKSWAENLEAKGLVLAPVSAAVSITPKPPSQ